MNETLRGLKLIALIVLLVAAVFVVDVMSGREISISIFYLVPIALATWNGSRAFGFLLSFFCAVLWLFGERIGGASYSNEIIPWWNMVVRFAFFSIVTQTLAARRRVEAELVHARANALAASSAKSDFLNRVTHELRTPLTAILGFTDVLHKRAATYLTPEDRDCIRRIRVNSESLLALVDGVLDIGSVEARRRPPAREAVDLPALVNAVAADIRGRTLPESLNLVVDAPDGIDPLVTDPALLRQVLLNLVSNAVKFTESGSIRLHVIAADGRPERIQIQDTGIGIPPDKVKVIFDPFEQADGSIHRRYGGAGLGLAISKDLCEVMGHSLEVESRPGVGSTFSVVFSEAASGAQIGT